MSSTESWWRGEIDWNTPAGQLLHRFLSLIPRDRQLKLTLYGSAPLQLTVDPSLLSADVDLFSDNDEDLEPLIQACGLGREQSGLHFETGFELSFRTSPRWRTRAKNFKLQEVGLTIPHPLDILIGKLDRLAPKDVEAFRRVIAVTGHPQPEELKTELQNAVDLFRPGFQAESPSSFFANTLRLWREVFQLEIDVVREIIEPALARRQKGYGESPPDYKDVLREL